MSLKRIGQLLILLGFFCLAPACTSAENGKVDANAAPPITPPAVERESSGALDFANGLYARKMYGPAISEYAKFLNSPAAGQAPVEAASAYCCVFCAICSHSGIIGVGATCSSC